MFYRLAIIGILLIGFEHSEGCTELFVNTELPVATQIAQLGYSVNVANPESSLRVLLVSESHYEKEHLEAQEKLIEWFLPSHILHEFAGAWIYKPEAGWHPLPNRKLYPGELTYGEPFPECPPSKLLQLSDKHGFSIVGTDLSASEFKSLEKTIAQTSPQEYRMRRNELEKIGDPSFVFSPHSDEAIPFRDKHMVEQIIQWEKVSDGILIVILGRTHAQNLYASTKLKELGFGYALLELSKNK